MSGTPLPVNALCTRAEVQAFGRITASDYILDNSFHVWIGSVSTSFESYCGRTFRLKQYIEYHDGEGKNKIFLNNYPVVSAGSVWIDPYWQWGSDTLIDPSLYHIKDDMTLMLYNTIVSKGDQNIKVSYYAGYQTIPADLKQACIEEVFRLYKYRDEINVAVKQMADGSLTFQTDAFLPKTTQVLDGYKRVAIL